MVEQEVYGTVTGWGWLFMVYFFGVMVAFVTSVITMDDFFFSKKKKFSWFGLILVLFFTAFSWFGFIAIIKFDGRHNTGGKW